MNHVNLMSMPAVQKLAFTCIIPGIKWSAAYLHALATRWVLWLQAFVCLLDFERWHY